MILRNHILQQYVVSQYRRPLYRSISTIYWKCGSSCDSLEAGQLTRPLKSFSCLVNTTTTTISLPHRQYSFTPSPQSFARNSHSLFGLYHDTSFSSSSSSSSCNSHLTQTSSLIKMRGLFAQRIEGALPSFSYHDKMFCHEKRYFSNTTTHLTQHDQDNHNNNEATTPKPPLLRRVYTTVKNELIHYWKGTKLLWANICLSVTLIRKLLNGHSLVRREKLMLKRTTSDVLRVFPFLIFAIVPFLEFTLPFFIKLFPNMLPTTFETALQREERYTKELKARLEVTSFLQDTIKDLTKEARGVNPNSGKENSVLLERAFSGEELSLEEIVKVARLVEEQFALDNLDRDQLTAICKFLNLQTLGTTGFLRYRLAARFRELHEDDQVIYCEGLNSLTSEELQAACAARGMRSQNVPTSVLERQMKQWLELSLQERLPVALMVISRVLTINSNQTHQPAANREETLENIRQLLKSKPDVLEEVRFESISSNSEESLEMLNKFREVLASSKEKTGTKVVEDFTAGLKDHEKDKFLPVFFTTLSMMTQPLHIQKETVEEQLHILSDLHDSEGDPRVKRLAQNLLQSLKELDKQVSTVTMDKLKFLDRDNDGYISIAELKAALSHTTNDLSPEQVAALWEEIDRDHDGRVTSEELHQLARKFSEDFPPSDPTPFDPQSKKVKENRSDPTTTG